MSDWYDNDHDFADGFVGGLILGAWLGRGSGADGDGTHPDYSKYWKPWHPRTLLGLIVKFVVYVGTALFIVASIAALIYTGVTSGFNL